ncbi:MAG: glycosyltransferase family 2 protein, partial [Desulfobacterales bacterium]|nr:glycosyltransferase family 2 protein [Desulfobacterales bacterium]
AKNKYITFLDADDIWLPDFLQTINNLVVKYSQAGIYSTAYTLVYPNKRIDKLCKQETQSASLIINNYCQSLVKNEIFTLWTGAICVKKELFGKVGAFPEKIKRGEDLDMWLRLSLVSSIAIFNQSKALYNKETENNAMASYNSYKESFPYWQWYTYGKTQFLKDYTTNMIMALIRSALRYKKYKDVILLLFKVENNRKINALCLTLLSFIRLVLDRNR